ncbi:Calcineurin-like metallo-phosphoesterase superfamily protein isoform 1 [Hibiscus syriacus]|uniref:Calcineurin-like metallo-phosphoesterase superfamily protein isoform 1 n=1 Tax=Hibiscus syriacus TaxID=106335 RepID=A0A6A2ZD67_HIBSY|nr:Calcineurin-like metallo-phosphoesterase superfamily protein isoform 1 [Hibiscus syriacus]
MGDVTSNVAAKLAFFPPDPPTYEVYRKENGKLVLPGITADKNMDVHLLDTGGGNTIVATFCRQPFARFTLFYSHANAADIGQMHELRAHFRVNIMRVLSILWQDLPFFCKLYKYFDLYIEEYLSKYLQNIDKIQPVTCPVLVVHGTDDETVDWSHGKRLWELSKESMSLYGSRVVAIATWNRSGVEKGLLHRPQESIPLIEPASWTWFLSTQGALREGNGPRSAISPSSSELNQAQNLEKNGGRVLRFAFYQTGKENKTGGFNKHELPRQATAFFLQKSEL